MNVTAKLSFLVFLCSCGLDNTPVIYIDTIGHRDLANKAVEAWSKLGFYYTPENPKLKECDRTWYSDTFESQCQITLRLRFIKGLNDDDVGGKEVMGKVDYETREVLINTRLQGNELQHVLTHEFGHILLDCNHLESYINPSWSNVGIMSWMPTWLLEPTENDYALACRTIGVCVN